MFNLSIFKDVIRVAPHNFNKDRNVCIADEINLKYANKVIHNVGLCIALFDIIKIGPELPREELYTRINNRVDEMIASGHIDEVRNLQIHKSLNALQTVGYREIFDFFDGKINEERAIELIKQNTRHYAKRQLTWFKKDLETTWLNPQFDQVRSYVNQTIKWSN